MPPKPQLPPQQQPLGQQQPSVAVNVQQAPIAPAPAPAPAATPTNLMPAPQQTASVLKKKMRKLREKYGPNRTKEADDARIEKDFSPEALSEARQKTLQALDAMAHNHSYSDELKFILALAEEMSKGGIRLVFRKAAAAVGRALSSTKQCSNEALRDGIHITEVPDAQGNYSGFFKLDLTINNRNLSDDECSAFKDVFEGFLQEKGYKVERVKSQDSNLKITDVNNQPVDINELKKLTTDNFVEFCRDVQEKGKENVDEGGLGLVGSIINLLK